ncbi:MAG: hypothetical protein Q9191_007894 [Dirinaria sp. TL-2023a]
MSAAWEVLAVIDMTDEEIEALPKDQQMEIFFSMHEREVFGRPPQLPKCHKHLKDNVRAYDLRIEQTAVLVRLAASYMMDQNRRHWLYLHGLKHFDDVDDHRVCTRSESRQLGPWIANYQAMVAAEFQDDVRIAEMAKDILFALYDFRKQQWNEMYPDAGEESEEEDATAGALEKDWEICNSVVARSVKSIPESIPDDSRYRFLPRGGRAEKNPRRFENFPSTSHHPSPPSAPTVM